MRYASERRQFGKAIGEFQLIQAMLADSQAELLAAWSLVREVAGRFDQKPAHVSDPDVSMRVSCAKLFATEMLGRVADRGVQVHGGAGYINEYPVERFYRDAPAAPVRGHDPGPAAHHRARELLRQQADRQRSRLDRPASVVFTGRRARCAGVWLLAPAARP